jgi:prefoldin alpha subunit
VKRKLSKKEVRDEQQEKLRGLIVELKTLEGTVEELETRVGIIDQAMRELNIAGMTLQNLKTLDTETETLIPVGGGAYLKAKIIDKEKVIIGIGAGVAVEKTATGANEDVGNQLADLQKLRSSLEQQFNQVIGRIEEVRGEIQKITSTSKT